MKFCPAPILHQLPETSSSNVIGTDDIQNRGLEWKKEPCGRILQDLQARGAELRLRCNGQLKQCQFHCILPFQRILRGFENNLDGAGPERSCKARRTAQKASMTSWGYVLQQLVAPTRAARGDYQMIGPMHVRGYRYMKFLGAAPPVGSSSSTPLQARTHAPGVCRCMGTSRHIVLGEDPDSRHQK